MAIARPGPGSLVYVGVGGGDENYQLLSDLVSIDVAHNVGGSTPGENSIDLSTGAEPPEPEPTTPGRITLACNPADGTTAWRDVRAALNAARYFRLDQGEAAAFSAPGAAAGKPIYESVTGPNKTTVAVAKAVHPGATAQEVVVTLADKGDGDGRANFGTNPAPRVPWNRGQFLEVEDAADDALVISLDYFTSSTTAVGSIVSKRTAGSLVVVPDSSVVSVVAATDEWKLWVPGVRWSANGLVLQAWDGSSASGSRTSNIQFQSSGFQSQAFLLAA